jgi:hypothetical protein
MKLIKQPKKECPALQKAACPLRQASKPNPPPALVIVRTERKSWFTIAITGFGAVLLRYFRVVRERGRSLRFWAVMLVLIALLIGLIATSGCQAVKPQKGGTASTSITQPGHTNSVTLAQSDNPKEPSRQSVQSEQTVEYVLPAGSMVSLRCGANPLPPSSPASSETAASPGTLPSVPNRDPGAFAVLQQPLPVKMVLKDRTETSVGGAQKDTAREWASRAANMQPVMWAGIALMTVVAGVLLYFGWWTKAAVAVGIGLAMIVMAQTLPEHGTLILFSGLGVFALAALLVLYAYYKGQLDQNHNGIPDFLEKKAAEAKT